MRARSPLLLLLALALGASSSDAQGQLAEPSGLDLADAGGADPGADDARLQAELEGLLARRDGARARLRGRVRTLYRLRRAGALPLAGGFEALLAHQARLDRLERLLGRDVASLAQIDRRVEALREEVGEREARRAANQARAAQQRAREASRQEQLRILSGMIEDPAAWSGAASGVRLADGSPLTSGLSEERGRLPLPVSGSVRLRDAEREGGAGLDVIADEGARVRAVSRGRVAYAAPHPGYGQLVLLEHDGGYYTVYGGLGAVAVDVGEALERGRPLGVVGPQALFFQVRRGTRPLSAREWLGI